MPEGPHAAGHLHAPWRMAYIKSLESDAAERDPLAKKYGGCFLCAAANWRVAVDEMGENETEAMRRRLVVWDAPLVSCVINRYPYTSGHLMIAPRRHVADLEELTADEAAALHENTVLAIERLRGLMDPQGFNVGINLGKSAGAGVPGHLHRHVVPRWAGDTNFMSVVGEVRIVPQAPERLWEELRRHAGLDGGGGGA